MLDYNQYSSGHGGAQKCTLLVEVFIIPGLLMTRVSYQILFVAVFMTYMTWGAYWFGACSDSVAESCIAGRWALLFTGLPSTLITLGMGGVGMGELIITAFIGGLQWAALVLLIVHLITTRRMKFKED